MSVGKFCFFWIYKISSKIKYYKLKRSKTNNLRNAKKKLATKQIFRLFNLISDLEYKSRKKCVNRIIGCL